MSTHGCDPCSAPAEYSVGESIPTIGAAIAEWLVYLELRGRPATTRTTYRSILGALVGSTDSLLDLDAPRCNALMLDKLRTRSASSASVLHAALAGLLDFARENHWTTETMAMIPRPKVKSKQHRYLSKDELCRIFAASKPKDRPMLLLLLTGLRVAELCAVRWQDYDGEGRLRILFTKGGQPRTIAVGAALRAELGAMKHQDGTIIGLTTAGVRRRLQRIGRNARVASLHPHLLRHTFATHFLIEGGIESRGALKALGGWRTDEMLDHYTRSAIADAALKRADEIDLTARLLE